MFVWKDWKNPQGIANGYAGLIEGMYKNDVLMLNYRKTLPFYSIIWPTVGLALAECLASINVFMASIDLPFPRTRGVMVGISGVRHYHLPMNEDEFFIEKTIELPFDPKARELCGIPAEKVTLFQLDIPVSFRNRAEMMKGLSFTVWLADSGGDTDQQILVMLPRKVIPAAQLADFWSSTRKRRLGAKTRAELARMLGEHISRTVV